MRATLNVLFLLCALAAIAAAQGAGDKRSASGVEVTNFGWKYDGYVPVEVVRSDKSGVVFSVKRGTGYVFKYTARATVRNTGAKAIKSIEWDYVFTDPDGGKELRRYRLQSKQQVEPGATAALVKEVAISPDENTHHITAGRQTVEITRVEFADGSVWRREEEKKP
ncbi:MAG TPA: hypothetical protein VFA21_17365 [Pyrinomonadaceae bacterium]|nr:hypothetical protein [Pyrinomonadaceae bacterium]